MLFVAKLADWGGSKPRMVDGKEVRLPTCKLTCICMQDGPMVSDHIWLGPEDTQKLINNAWSHEVKMERFKHIVRPKPGLKISFSARCTFYDDGRKAKPTDIDNISPVPFESPGKQSVYWNEKMGRDNSTPLWHGGKVNARCVKG